MSEHNLLLSAIEDLHEYTMEITACWNVEISIDSYGNGIVHCDDDTIRKRDNGDLFSSGDVLRSVNDSKRLLFTEQDAARTMVLLENASVATPVRLVLQNKQTYMTRTEKQHLMKMVQSDDVWHNQELLHHGPVVLETANEGVRWLGCSQVETLMYMIILDDVVLLCLPEMGNRLKLEYTLAVNSIKIQDSLVEEIRNKDVRHRFKIIKDTNTSFTFIAGNAAVKQKWMEVLALAILPVLSTSNINMDRGWQHGKVLGTIFQLAQARDYRAMQILSSYLTMTEMKQMVNQVDGDGASPLIIAAIGGCLKTLKQILKAGADPHAVDKFQLSALAYASMYQYPHCIQELLRWNADVHQVDCNGCTPLMHAALNEDPLVEKQVVFHSLQAENSIALLQQHGAEIDQQDHDDMTALEHNICCDVDRSRVLLSLGASIHTLLQGKNTLLHLACDSRLAPVNAQAIGLLLQWGAQPNQRNAAGLTPLHILLGSYYDAKSTAPPPPSSIRSSRRRNQSTVYHAKSQRSKMQACQGKLTSYYGPVSASLVYNQGNAQHRILAAELLLSHGARLDIRNNQGDTIESLISVLRKCHVATSINVWMNRQKPIATPNVLRKHIHVKQNFRVGASWKHDDNRDDSGCGLCQSNFDMLHRKHHCRLCAQLICGKCATKRIIVDTTDANSVPTSSILPPSSILYKRVCDGCFNFARYEIAREGELQ